MDMKPSCRSQYAAISSDVESFLDKGFSKKSIYDYYKKRGVITMSYSAWLVILRYKGENNPFRRLPKKKFTESIPDTSADVSKFQHNKNPYQEDSKPQEKKDSNDLEVRFVQKKKQKKDRN